MENPSENLVSAIRNRYESFLSRVADAAAACGRKDVEIKVVVVSKTQPLEKIRAAISAGVQIFGENYAEEAEEKITALGESAVEWHMIGHVQSRKAKLVAKYFHTVHSLDSLKLAARLDRFCEENGKMLPVLLECNVSGEESKSGFAAWKENEWMGLLQQFEGILAYPHLVPHGIMTMPPLFEDPEKTRPYFARLKRLQGFLEKHLPQSDWSELSMGTSADFPAAIQEGATMVRIGTAIMGPRTATR